MDIKPSVSLKNAITFGAMIMLILSSIGYDKLPGYELLFIGVALVAVVIVFYVNNCRSCKKEKKDEN